MPGRPEKPDTVHGGWCSVLGELLLLDVSGSPGCRALRCRSTLHLAQSRPCGTFEGVVGQRAVMRKTIMPHAGLSTIGYID